MQMYIWTVLSQLYINIFQKCLRINTNDEYILRLVDLLIERAA